MKTFYTLLAIVAGLLPIVPPQQIMAAVIAPKQWNAQWISVPGDNGKSYGVFNFRKSIEVKDQPHQFVVHISADNRYKLYVNNKLVSLGPARGDSYYWNYETVDIAPYLAKGKNIVAALVWNEAEDRPEAQISVRTGLIIQGNAAAEEILNTNSSWKCFRDPGRFPVPGYFFAASKGEMVDMNVAVNSNWTSLEFDDTKWPDAVKIADGKIKGTAWGVDWALVPSSLPAREMTYQRLIKLRSAEGLVIPANFPAAKAAITVPAHTTASILLDQTFLTNAYLTLNFSTGKNAGISIGYAESLYEKNTKGTRKGNRDSVAGKEFIGRIDSLISDGSKDQRFTTLNFRTYRYIRIFIHTENDPLVIDDLYGTFTGYPFKRRASISSGYPEINQLLDIGWRTARLNAWETYTDCPYYEQLQYIGDTRIQALVSYYNTDDIRLARNALNQIDHSRLPEGVTHSCYPSKGTQVISTFSLWYIGMLHDYWMYRGDNTFIKNKLQGERGVLDFFSKYQQADGSLKDTPYWAFVDWAGNMWGKVKGKDGSAAIYDLQLLMAYQWAAEMEAKTGIQDYARLYTEKAAQLKHTIRRKYWDQGKNLFADTKEKTGFSQHVNSLAILSGVAQGTEKLKIARKMLSDTSLTQCSVYFKYYLNQALVKAGLGDDYLNWLAVYRQNIAMGLTTWAEYSDINSSRSDCHAWGASPNIEFFRTLLGIDSYAPGFRKIKVEPHLGSIKKISGEMPHPDGKITVNYILEKGKWNIAVSLPGGTDGILVWKARQYPLKAGNNHFML